MKVWGIAATLGFAVLAFGFGQAVGVGAATAATGGDLSQAANDGAAVALSVLVGDPVQIVTLALAARMTGEDLLAYFALDVPRRRDVMIAVAGLAVVIVVGDALTLALGRELVPPFQLQIHRSAQAEGALISLWLSLIVVAPIGEELLFRGFLFRGFVREPRDALPGILAISLIWSLLHIQYDWFGASLVFAIGMLLGYVRLYSGSTTLVILLHMLLNFESVAETVVALGWV
ncbi:MAG TPA: CPBP family intramembrane glutamic endopeptidase [Xanthobacteraceae bacterium]|jgi:membrane protease YdiL (CAAX protease family)|nr:CPBP family intramembrane glutamic endopeptidase [Xanthobacteraceae bacterium]